MSDWKNVQYKDGKMRTSEGGGGGSSTFAGLDDVSFNDIQNGQVPKYNSETHKWENANESGRGGTVTDVTVDGVSVVNQQGVAEIEMPTPPAIPVEDVEVNGASVVNAQKVAEIKSYKEVTQAEYNALPASKTSDGILYCIKDSAGADGFPPLIYSDEEREVGVWRDGKPLYQKTFVLPNQIIISNTDWTSIGVLASSINAESYIRCFALTETGTLWDAMNVATIDSYIALTSWRNGDTIAVKTVVIQYTKTTDTPGSGTWNQQGGYAHHYSTTEHVIGTWIDGKPIYEKTIDTGLIPSNTTKQIPHNIVNIAKIIYYKGIALDTNGSEASAMPYVGFNNWSICLYVTSTNICIQTLQNWSSSFPQSYVTIQYTKTTD